MKINLENYEAYFLDYLENRLTEETKSELEIFLQQNPSLRKVLNEFENVTLCADSAIYSEKEDLYKFRFNETKITPANFSNFCIAFHENLLSNTKKKEIKDFIQKKPNLEKDFLLFRKTHLVPNLKITFPLKSKLYHHKFSQTKKTILRITIYGSIAASIAAGIFIYTLRINNSKTIDQTYFTESVIKNPSPKNYFVKREISIGKKIITTKNIRTIPQKKNNIVPSIAKTENRSTEIILKRIIPIQGKIQTSTKKYYSYSLPEIIATNNEDENSSEKTIPEMEKKSNISERRGLLTLAETGINKINKLFGSNFELSHQTDESGKINSLSINTGIFGYYHKRAN